MRKRPITFTALTLALLGGYAISQSQDYLYVVKGDSAYYRDNPPGIFPSLSALVDVKADMIQSADPIYPRIALAKRLEGFVILRCWVGSDGLVRESKVYSSSDTIFNREALIASLQWAFKPAMKNGHPVDAFYLAGVIFEIRKLSSNGYAIQEFPQSEVDISKPFPPRHDTLTYPSSVDIPPAARLVLDEKLPNWRAGKVCEDPKNPKYNSFFKCYLNRDPKPDFVLVVITGSGSSLTEHYVAIVSTANKYEAFILRSYNISELSVDEYTVFIDPRNTPVTVLGDLDRDLKYEPAKDGAGAIFDVDCVHIGSLVGNECQTFVFQNGKFHEFSSCD